MLRLLLYNDQMSTIPSSETSDMNGIFVPVTNYMEGNHGNIPVAGRTRPVSPMTAFSACHMPPFGPHPFKHHRYDKGVLGCRSVSLLSRPVDPSTLGSATDRRGGEHKRSPVKQLEMITIGLLTAIRAFLLVFLYRK